MANYKQVDLFFVKKYSLIVSRDKKNQDHLIIVISSSPLELTMGYLRSEYIS